MSAGVDVDGEKAILSRLLGAGASPVSTPEMLAAGLQWVLMMVRKELAERPGTGGQEWGRVADVMRIYGVARSQANVWLARLRELGKVRVCNPISGAKGKGDTLYYLPDIEAAFMENAQSHGQDKY